MKKKEFMSLQKKVEYIYKNLNELAILHNQILKEMDMLFMTQTNIQEIEKIRIEIENMYHLYEKKLEENKKEGLCYIENYANQLKNNMVKLGDLLYIKELQNLRNMTTQFYRTLKKQGNYLSLDTTKKTFIEDVSTIRRNRYITIPEEFKDTFGDAKRGKLTFYYDGKLANKKRIQKLEMLRMFVLQKKIDLKPLGIDIDSGVLEDLIDIEIKYIEKYIPYQMDVMQIKVDQYYFDIYGEEIKLPEQPKRHHVRLIDRDGKLIPSIKDASFKNQLIFYGPEELEKRLSRTTYYMKDKKVTPYQLTSKK